MSLKSGLPDPVHRRVNRPFSIAAYFWMEMHVIPSASRKII
jgi:hypothetical protein